jgi:hypothetical protein
VLEEYSFFSCFSASDSSESGSIGAFLLGITYLSLDSFFGLFSLVSAAVGTTKTFFEEVQ